VKGVRERLVHGPKGTLWISALPASSEWVCVGLRLLAKDPRFREAVLVKPEPLRSVLRFAPNALLVEPGPKG
jgi:hypothetical protein